MGSQKHLREADQIAMMNRLICTCVASSQGGYSKVPKFLDARKLCCNLTKIQIKRPNLRVFRQKDANGIANSEDPDQIAFGLHCLLRPVCPKT